MRGPSLQPFDQATNTANLRVQPADCKSLNPNILPITHLFSRFYRTSQPGNSANRHACNELEEASRNNHSATSTTKSLFFKILPANHLDSRFCAAKNLANRTNSNEINILNIEVGKMRKRDSHDFSATNSQAFGCCILGLRVKQSAWPAACFLGTRSSRLATKHELRRNSGGFVRWS